MTFKDKLVRLMNVRNIKPSALADSLGVSRSAVNSWTHKGNIPYADTGIKLSRKLDVDPNWLFDSTRSWPPRSRLAEALRLIHQETGIRLGK